MHEQVHQSSPLVLSAAARVPWLQQHPASGTSRSATSHASAAGAPRGKQLCAPKAGATSIALLQEVINEQESLQKGETSFRYPEIPVDTACYTKLSLLQKTLCGEGQNWDAAGVVNHILDELVPTLRNSRVESLHTFRSVLEPHLSKVVARKLRNMTAEPSVNRICTLYWKLGVRRTAQTLSLMDGLLRELTAMKIKPDDFGSVQEYQGMLETRRWLLNDLVSTWRVFLYPLELAHLETKHNSSEDHLLHAGFHISTAASTKRRPQPTMVPGEIDEMLLGLFPQIMPSAKHLLRIAALSTYAVLTDPDRSNARTQLEARDFLAPISSLLRAGVLDRNYIEQTFFPNPKLCEYVCARWPSITKSAAKPDFARNSAASSHVHAVPHPYKTIHRRVAKAFLERDLQGTINVWREFQKEAGPLSGNENVDEPIKKQLDHFVYIFMALRAPDIATQVWNHIEALGITPGIRTWTSMLHGCQSLKNPAAVENIWARLLASGTALDAHAWTSRISGLAQGGEIRAALSALDQMISAWENKADGAVQPTMSPVNALLPVLIERGMLAEFSKLLEWASSKGLEPDVFTINILLGLANKMGQPEARREIFQKMHDAKVKPNDATVTLYMEGELRDGSQLSPEAQAIHTRYILEHARSYNFRINEENYGKMVNLLIKNGPESSDSVKVVLNHMQAQGRDLSPHICAMLADYYFSLVPPDTDAVAKLVQTRQHSGETDRVFWERILNGFAATGMIKEAVQIWNKLSKSWTDSRTGPPIPLHVAYAFSTALIRHQRLGDARQVVQMMEEWALSHAKVESKGDLARVWNHRLWSFAENYGLLKGIARTTDQQSQQQQRRRKMLGGSL